MKNPRPICPNEGCQNHQAPPANFYWKRGYYRPRHNHQKVPRYQCPASGRWFGATQAKALRHHKRPDLNQQVFHLAVSGASMRRMVLVLGCSRTTIARKIEHLAQQALPAARHAAWRLAAVRDPA